MHFKLRKGIDLPLSGQPDARIDSAGEVKQVAVLGGDYIGLRPTMLVQVGERVQLGSPLFEDKKNPGVIITAPAAGTVAEINRGAKRALLSLVIDVEGEDAIEFSSVSAHSLASLNEQDVRQNLLKSGMWTAFRTRPYGKIPAIDSVPNSIVVSAMDSNPLAANPLVVLQHRAADFSLGVQILEKIGVPIYVCKAHGDALPDISGSAANVVDFSGPHPAGLSSTHVHFVDPVNSRKTVWTIGYQDVIAIGKLFVSGEIDVTRYVALGGPFVNSPRIFETRMGARVSELVKGRTLEGEFRIVSGSVFNGHEAIEKLDYLGRYDLQISIIEEAQGREFMGWAVPGTNRFSALNVFLSSLLKPRSFRITTSQYGSPRAIVPIGVYEKVMPLDILPTPLLRSIVIKDTDAAQELGCLELVEEDLALCTFVDPGKHDFGVVLRAALSQIEREG